MYLPFANQIETYIVTEIALKFPRMELEIYKLMSVWKQLESYLLKLLSYQNPLCPQEMLRGISTQSNPPKCITVCILIDKQQPRRNSYYTN